MRRACPVLFVLLLVRPPKVSGKPWAAPEFPNPQTDTLACGRQGRKSWVCDPDGVLSVNEANEVENMIKEIASQDSPCESSGWDSQDTSGYQVAVAIMKQMKHTLRSKASGHKFAKALHNAWGVGHFGCNDGVVLVVAVDDRLMGISTGEKVKNRVNERKILDEMKPFMRRQEYAGGVMRGIDEIGKELGGKGNKIQKRRGGKEDESEENISAGSIVGYVFLGLFFAAFISIWITVLWYFPTA